MSDEKLKAALSFDALDTAEVLTGRSYKEDPATLALGIAEQFRNSAARGRMLEEAGDTTFSCPLDKYERIIRDEGFQLVLDIPFTHPSGDGREESFRVHYHAADGILLKYDTYFNRTSVNGGSFYYNWRTDDIDNKNGVTSSGSWHGEAKGPWHPGLVWAGDHDCREAIRFHIRQLRNAGQFVTPWVARPFMYLIHYGDPARADYRESNALNEKRVELLPEWVRARLA